MKVKLHGGPNQTSVEKGGDDLWIAEKFQSSSDIAGSPRNSFRASLEQESDGGRALNRLGGHKLTEAYQTSNTIKMILRSQTASYKIRSQKGNSPDLQLRSLIHAKWKTM